MATLMLGSGLTTSGGLWTNGSTWSLCASGAELDVRTTNTNIGTNLIRSGSFAPGDVVINALAFKTASKVSAPTGSFIYGLWDATGNALVANTSGVIPNIDFPSGATAQSGGGWIVFPTQGNVTLTAATYYQVFVQSTVANQTTLYSSGVPTGSNWARQLVSTTIQAPAAGDKLLIYGRMTGSNTGSRYYVDVDDTASTDYGPIEVGKFGTLQFLGA